jgi:hypothetical protein
LPAVNSLARLGYRASRFARSAGLHKMVRLAKRIGLRKIFFGRPNPAILPRLTDEDRRWFLAQLGDEMEALGEFLGLRALPCRPEKIGAARPGSETRTRHCFPDDR